MRDHVCQPDWQLSIHELSQAYACLDSAAPLYQARQETNIILGQSQDLHAACGVGCDEMVAGMAPAHAAGKGVAGLRLSP